MFFPSFVPDATPCAARLNALTSSHNQLKEAVGAVEVDLARLVDGGDTALVGVLDRLTAALHPTAPTAGAPVDSFYEDADYA